MEEKTLDSKSILKKSFKIIYDSALYLLLFEILYKGLILIFFKPIINIIIFLFIRAGGYEILVNGEISQFLLSFTGIFMIIVVTSLAVVLVYYEFSVILLILDSSKKKEEIKLLFITERALLKLKNVIQSKNIGLAMYILLLIPILNIEIQSSLLPVLSIPDFITGEIAKYPGSGVLFFVLSFALMYLFAKLFLVLPLMVFSDRSFKEASKISFETIKGEVFKIALLIITGMIVWLILTYLPFMIVENVQFILRRLLRALSSASLSIFTLLISPFILSISFGIYSSYLELGYFNREGMKEEIELG